MKMLAYIVNFKDADWCTLIHGETRNKAKYRFMRCEPTGWHDSSMWTEIRLQRLPKQDDKPFTYEIAGAAGFRYGTDTYDENGNEIEHPEWFSNDCDCEICNKGK